MRSRLFSFAILPLVFGLALSFLPTRFVSASVCCHCYFDRQPADQRTQCLQLEALTSCDADAIETYQAVTAGPTALRPTLVSRPDLAFHCDASPVSSVLCRAGTGSPGDRCPSRPPIRIPENSPGAAFIAAYPQAPAPGSAGGSAQTNSTNATNGTSNNSTNSSGDSEGTSGGSGNATPRQERARDYSRNFPNPLPGLTIQKTIGGIVRIVVGLVGILFLLVFVWGSFLYMTAAGDPKQTQKGKDAIKNAVIGLAIVMISYTAVSLLVDAAGNLMGTTTAPTVSQEEGSQSGRGAPQTPAPTPSATDEPTLCGCTCGDSTTSFAPITGGEVCTETSCRTLCGTTCTSHGGVVGASCSGSGSLGGSSPDTCARFYGGPVENCFRTGGSCPSGVNNLDDLINRWSSRLPGGNIPSARNACRSCIAGSITTLAARFPGLDTSCVPALVSEWNGTCLSACVGTGAGSSGGVSDASMLCSTSGYQDDESCRACITHAATVLEGDARSPEAQAINRAGCPTPQGKILVWCATGHEGWSAPGSICSFR